MTEDILLTHARRYPAMEPRDAVKLLYQSRFGGGHLIQNEESCMAYLRREYTATPQRDCPLLEDIGNGFVRVMLSALDAHGYSAVQLGQDFIRCAASVQGSMEEFQKTLAILTALTRQGKMPFSPQALENYLDGYAAAGFPAVSHSEAYRNTYHPAYRVLHRDYLPEEFRKQV